MSISQLYPHHKKYTEGRGVYLDDPFLSEFSTPIVYSNFLSSLDGRIAISEDKRWTLPERLIDELDQRLFRELQAQADCLITHGGYMRALAAGHLNDVLHIGKSKKYADLAAWRAARGLSAQPLIVICSNTLEFPIPDDLQRKDIWIATSEGCERQRIQAWERRGYRVIRAGERRVEGGALSEQLIRAGYRRMYLCAGPELFESCLRDRCVALHYMTLSMQLLGHTKFLTMLAGYTDLSLCRLELVRLILDEASTSEKNPSPSCSQFYLTFKVHYAAAPIKDLRHDGSVGG